MWVTELPSIIGNFITGIIEDIFKPFLDLDTLSTLVFGNQGDNKLIWLTFTDKEWNNIIVEDVGLFIEVAYYCMLFGIIFMSIMISKAGMNPQTRTNVLEMAGALILVAFLLKNLDIIYSAMFTINRFVVSLVETKVTGNDLSVSKLHDGGLGFLLIWGAYLGLSLWANIYYLMRKFSLMVLMILGPVFISLFLFHPFRSITLNWMRDLFATIMTQSIHAVILLTFLQMDNDVTDNWVVKLVMLAAFIPIGEGIKALFGLTPSMTGKMSVVMMASGAAGLTSVVSAAQTAFGRRSFFDQLEDRYVGKRRPTAGDGAASAANESTSSGTGGVSALPTSVRTHRMLNAGRVGARIGKSIFQMVGAAAGMPLGPGATFAGAVMAGKAGEALGGLAGRAGYTAFDNGRQRMMASINEELDKLNENYGITPIHQVGSMEGHTDFQPKALGHLGAKTHAVAKGIAKSFIPRQLGRVGKTAYKAMGPAERRRLLIERAGHLGGVVLGEGGVQLGQQVAAKLYTELDNEIRNQGYEYSDFQREYENHNIKDVRIAVTSEYSTILGKVRNADGTYTERRLTNYLGGDASLKEGQVVYKDLHIQQGRITDGPALFNLNGDFYTEDSQGGKKRFSKRYAINPYDYFEDRNDGSERYFRPDRFKQGIV